MISASIENRAGSRMSELRRQRIGKADNRDANVKLLNAQSCCRLCVWARSLCLCGVCGDVSTALAWRSPRHRLIRMT
jgi:hypothetical protein